MKRSIPVIPIYCFILTFIVACTKTEENNKPTATSFQFSLRDIKATIPKINYLSYQPEVTAHLTLNLDSIVHANQGEASINKNVTSAKVERIQLTLLNTDTANNFSNFEYCNVTFSNVNGTQSVVVADSEIPRTGTSSLTLQGRNIELLNYIKNGEFKVTVNGKARNATTKELSLVMDFLIKIEQQ